MKKLRLASETQANAFRLVFAQRRGSLGILGTRPCARHVVLQGRTLTILLEEPLCAGGVLSIDVEATGESLRIVRHQEKLVSKSLIDRDPPPVEALGLTASETSLEDIFAWRDSRATGDFAREKRFFNAMDRATWVQDTDHKEVLELLEGVFAQRHAGDLTAANVLEQTADATKLRKFSDVFANCIVAEYGDPATHVLEVEDAFDRFARGELSLLDGTDSPTDPTFDEYKARACQPDSTYYLLFAEFAGLCVRHGVPGVPWQDLLPALVHTQQAFAGAYAGPGGNAILAGELLGGKWPPMATLSVDDLHAQRALFKADVAGVLDDVRTNFAQQFVQL